MLLLGSISSYMYLSDNHLLKTLNNKILDSFFIFRKEVKPSKNVVIVDIDEKSLKELGQWPWGRDKIATILKNLNASKVGIIGLDIVFAEADNSSPKRILEEIGRDSKGAPDFDFLLAETLKSTPTILGYMFNFKEKLDSIPPNIPMIIIEKNRPNKNYLPVAKGVVSNIPLLQENAYSSGFFNTIPDDDGIVRSVPLVINYKQTIYPSLTLEILRLAYGVKKVVINYDKTGVESIYLGKFKIPTDRFGRLILNYYGKAKAFKYISAVDIYTNNFSKSELEGKIVLIGTSAGGLLDLRATPFESTYPGVEIHATAIENILTQSFISHPDWIVGADLLIVFVLLIFIVVLFSFFKALQTALFSLLALSAFIYFAYYEFAYYGLIFNVIYPLISSLFLYMVLSSLYYKMESKQKELIRGKFAKKVSKTVAESLIAQGDQDFLSAREKEVTLFFSDIRGFTTISEKFNDPKKLIDFLNLYMTPMTKIIIKNQGTVDKFIGDAIMAYWNAPLEVKNHADMALQSAIEQIKELKILNKSLKEKGLPRIDIGIGINTGTVVVGEMGSVGRSDYTIIGDSVNLGSRAESLCKIYKAEILITQFTKDKLKNEYNIEFVDDVKVKGKEQSVKIYRVLV